MIATKVLTNLNDAIGPIVIPRDAFVTATVQYGSSGLGTIALEGTLNEIDYVAVGLTPVGGGAVVATLTAAGMATANVTGYRKVQLRKTVAGGGGVTASLGLPAS